MELTSMPVRLLVRQGAIAEGQIFELLAQERRVIRSFEHAPCDGILDCRIEPLAVESATDRTHSLYQSKDYCDGRTFCLPFDIKNLTASVSARSNNTTWNINCTQYQIEEAQFLIVTLTAFPDIVALLPMDFLRPSREEKEMLHIQSYHRETSRKVKLPVKLLPFIMQRPQLPEALNRVIGVAMHTMKGYVNPGTEVRFPQWQPQLRPPQSIISTTSRMAASSSRLMWLWNQFRTSGLGLKMHHGSYLPLLGDFHIHLNDLDVVVEHKYTSVGMRRNGSILAIKPFGQDRLPWFSGICKWDYIYMESPDEGWALFLPRTRVPFPWWMDQAPKVTVYTPWNEVQEFFLNYNDAGWISRVHAIISRYGRAEIPNFVIGPADEITGQEAIEEDQSACILDESLLLKKKGEAELRPSLPSGPIVVNIIDKLEFQCARQGRGLVFSLGGTGNGGHPLGQILFANWKWTAAEQASWDQSKRLPRELHELSALSLVVTISFGMTEELPSTRYSRHFVAQAPPRGLEYGGFLILDLAQWPLGALDHGWYVLPSDSIVLFNKSFQLRTPGHLGMFLLHPAEVVEKLDQLFQGPESVTFGNCSVQPQVHVRFLKLVHQLCIDKEWPI